MSAIEESKTALAAALRAEGIEGDALKRVSGAVAGYVGAIVRHERETASTRLSAAVRDERHRIAKEERMQAAAKRAMDPTAAWVADIMRGAAKR